MKKIVLSLGRLLTLALLAVSFRGFAAEPTVTDIMAKQRYPWNGLVDISCKVSGIEAEAGEYEFAVVAVDKETGKEYTASNFSIEHGGADMSGLDVSENGTYNLLWNAREDLGQIVIERMTLRITLAAVAEDEAAEDEDLDTRKKVQLWAGGPYWADRNIGASKPWKYGSYFWWGDTTGYRPSGGTFVFNFSDGNSTIYTYRKGDSKLQSAGWMTSDGVLAPSHDAVHVKWGGDWRMPTYRELFDLSSKCDWTWGSMNGVNGYIVRGKGDYASKSIFLPAAGYGRVTSLGGAGSDGYYLSAVPFPDIYYYCGLAYGLYFDPGNHRKDGGSRCYGQSVRPVQ